jgi:hypothetical protein
MQEEPLGCNPRLDNFVRSTDSGYETTGSFGTQKFNATAVLEELHTIFKKFFIEVKLEDPSNIHNPETRWILQGFLENILKNGFPGELVKPNSQGKMGPKRMLLKPKRSDQYIKKAHSKLKTIVFTERKTGKEKKCKTLQKIRRDFEFGLGKSKKQALDSMTQSDEKCFQNLFGGQVYQGLRDPTIDHILLHKPNLLKELFKVSLMKQLLRELGDQTQHDIQANLMTRLRVELQSGALQRPIEWSSIFSKDAKHFKKPFTQMENIFAVYFFIESFVRRCQVLEISQRKNLKMKMKRLKDLQSRLLKSASQLLNWEIKPPFNKQEVDSFVMYD